MNKTDLTTAFEQTSFLYGGNAQFIEQLYAKYLENPSAVDQHWRQFFAGLEDNAEQAQAQVNGPSWARKDWPRPESGELVSALDGQWPVVAPPAAKGSAKPAAADKPPGLSGEDVRKATMDSVRALMMIRAYRMRGHRRPISIR
jgi:2-oxoglutarate dehydrogenase E1 component